MKSFLQSREWADFQKSLSRKVWQIDSVNIIKYNLPLGKSYFYSPYCEGKFLSEDFLKKIKDLAKKENAIFFKAEPIEKIDFKRFRKSHDLQPRKTLILDITKSEQDLLKQMHSKTRYNIRLAEKKGVKIIKDKSKSENFWKLIQKTTKRDKFRPHPKEHYRKMLEIPSIELFSAAYKDKIIAANIIIFYKKTAVYLHGASDYDYRNLMAPFLLQWHQILQAKKQGCIKYDFWGIDEKKWPGMTRFKKGFNGQETEYPGAYDFIFQPLWYMVYKIARKIL